MKLQILIPQYKENDSVIKPLLDSIAIQQNVPMDEIGVIICNDGSDTFLSDELLNSYPFRIEYHKEPHRGVSGTRNACLDYATADYVMFCDADDMFCNVCGLWIIFREMGIDGGFDSMVSVFVEESRNPENKKEVTYINHDMDSTFVHGKVHRRKYLLKQKIRWNEKLTIHEDSYFNILCQNLSTNVKYCPMPFYLWKWRDESVCRHDPKYILKTYRNMLDSNDALVDEFLSRGVQDKAAFYTAFMIFDAYYAMNKEEWKNQENQEYRDSTEKRFAEYYEKHKDLWNSVPINDKMLISNNVRSRSVMEGMRMEAITIDGWLRHIEGMTA
jgi:glycosyltransferase involved in cell wall biosynthesis